MKQEVLQSNHNEKNEIKKDNIIKNSRFSVIKKKKDNIIDKINFIFFGLLIYSASLIFGFIGILFGIFKKDDA